MKSNFKFNFASTKQIICLKHSEDFQEKFNGAEGNPRQLQRVWEELATEISVGLTGKDAKVKYNSLYSVYKLHLDNSKKSGAGAVKWKYWEVFQETAPTKVRECSMVGIEEVYDGKIPVDDVDVA